MVSYVKRVNNIYYSWCLSKVPYLIFFRRKDWWSFIHSNQKLCFFYFFNRRKNCQKRKNTFFFQEEFMSHSIQIWINVPFFQQKVHVFFRLSKSVFLSRKSATVIHLFQFKCRKKTSIKWKTAFLFIHLNFSKNAQKLTGKK